MQLKRVTLIYTMAAGTQTDMLYKITKNYTCTLYTTTAVLCQILLITFKYYPIKKLVRSCIMVAHSNLNYLKVNGMNKSMPSLN